MIGTSAVKNFKSPTPLHRLLAACLLVILTACWAAPSGEYEGPRLDAKHHFQGKALQLARAIDRNDAASIQRLVQQEGVNPDILFSEQAMPMVAWPILNKNLTGLELLLKAGANPNARRVDAQRKTGKQRNNAMVLAAGEPDSRYLAMLLDHGGDPNTHNSNGEPLTYVAYLQNQWPNVQLLIERGANVNEGLYSPNDYNTVASWYSGLGNFDKVHWLLQHGADPTATMLVPEGHVNSGRMPILESIFWLPVQPHMIDWQKKCQQWAKDNGLERPPLPQYLKDKREKLGLPNEEKDIPLL